MNRLCRSQGITFVAVIIPTKPDVDLNDDRETFHKILSELEMTEEEYALNHRLGQRFAEAMAEREILCVDPTESMREREDPMYWRKDYHLNVAGNALLAKLVFDAIQTRLPKGD